MLQVVEDPTARHIVVLCRGQFFWFDVMSKDGLEIAVSEETIADNLETILHNVDGITDAEAMSTVRAPRAVHPCEHPSTLGRKRSTVR